MLLFMALSLMTNVKIELILTNLLNSRYLFLSFTQSTKCKYFVWCSHFVCHCDFEWIRKQIRAQLVYFVRALFAVTAIKMINGKENNYLYCNFMYTIRRSLAFPFTIDYLRGFSRFYFDSFSLFLYVTFVVFYRRHRRNRDIYYLPINL